MAIEITLNPTQYWMIITVIGSVVWLILHLFAKPQ